MRLEEAQKQIPTGGATFQQVLMTPASNSAPPTWASTPNQMPELQGSGQPKTQLVDGQQKQAVEDLSANASMMNTPVATTRTSCGAETIETAPSGPATTRRGREGNACGIGTFCDDFSLGAEQSATFREPPRPENPGPSLSGGATQNHQHQIMSHHLHRGAGGTGAHGGDIRL